jgi:hypothetical protein
MIDVVCRASRKANGDGELGLHIVEETDEIRQGFCQQLQGKELFQVFLECCTSYQLHR